MDLVEVAPQAQPPVARIMDYGKFKFESIKKEKDGRRKHNVIKVKEMKLRPKIGEHDFQTKFHAVKSFLEEGDKVKLTIMFRGREMVHQDIGKKLLDRMALELKTISTIERMPLLEGHKMILNLAKGFRMTHRTLFRPANEALLHALEYAYRDRRARKRDMRKLWIARINAASRSQGMPYNQFMHGLKLAGVNINRKMLADLAVRDAESFSELIAVAKGGPKS